MSRTHGEGVTGMSDDLLLRALKPPPDPEVPGWRRVSSVGEAYWDVQRWTEYRLLPGAVAAPPTWVSIALLALAVATTLFGGVLAGLMLGLYLLPALYASMRPTDWWRFEFSAVALVGILAGWTVVGWVAALVMAVMKDRPPT